MDKQDFNDTMDDILSSGGEVFNEFHAEELKELFAKVGDEVILDELVTDYYNGSEPSSWMEGELDYVASLLGSKAVVTVRFVS